MLIIWDNSQGDKSERDVVVLCPPHTHTAHNWKEAPPDVSLFYLDSVTMSAVPGVDLDAAFSFRKADCYCHVLLESVC